LIGDSIPGLAYVERGDSLIFWGTGDPSFLHPRLDSGKVYNFLKNSDKKIILFKYFYTRTNLQKRMVDRGL
jgi:D-alanyl-D-alanine carboxypeptidase/D-alanyl-D-alanine-endopeptidase (penicillin-binding protein 4)